MATYVYETIPAQADATPRRFEVVQSMKDAPLKIDPATGEPVRRVITGGYGFIGHGDKSSAHAAATPAPCAAGCACHSGPRIPQP